MLNDRGSMQSNGWMDGSLRVALGSKTFIVSHQNGYGSNLRDRIYPRKYYTRYPPYHAFSYLDVSTIRQNSRYCSRITNFERTPPLRNNNIPLHAIRNICQKL